MGVGQDNELVHGVVEYHQRIRQHERHRRHAQIIAGGGRQVFKIAHDIIRHIADSAPNQARQALQRHRIHRLEMALDHMQGVLPFGNGEPGRLPVTLEADDIVLDRENSLGIDADEGVAPDLLAALDALQQKSRRPRLLQLHVNRYRRLEISQQRSIDRHMIALLEVLVDFLAGGFDVGAFSRHRLEHALLLKIKRTQTIRSRTRWVPAVPP